MTVLPPEGPTHSRSLAGTHHRARFAFRGRKSGAASTTLIAPNLFHHQFISEWISAFPEAKAFLRCRAWRPKRNDIKFEGVLENVSAPEWSGQVDQLLIEGIPRYSEVVFFHRLSRALLVSDVVFNYSSAQAASDPGAAEGLGPHGRIRVCN